MNDVTKNLILFSLAITVSVLIVKGLIYNTTWAGNYF